MEGMGLKLGWFRLMYLIQESMMEVMQRVLESLVEVKQLYSGWLVGLVAGSW